MWNMSLMIFVIVNKSQRNTKTNTALVFVSNLWPPCSMASQGLCLCKNTKYLNVFLLKQEEMYLFGPIFTIQ